jgi:hypothetical protein
MRELLEVGKSHDLRPLGISSRNGHAANSTTSNILKNLLAGRDSNPERNASRFAPDSRFLHAEITTYLPQPTGHNSHHLDSCQYFKELIVIKIFSTIVIKQPV